MISERPCGAVDSGARGPGGALTWGHSECGRVPRGTTCSEGLPGGGEAGVCGLGPSWGLGGSGMLVNLPLTGPPRCLCRHRLYGRVALEVLESP